MSKKQNKNLVIVGGLGLAALGIWYFAKPAAAAAPPVTTLPPPVNTTVPGPTYVPPAPAPAVYPVIKGSAAKVGDKIWASGGPATIYKNVNPGTDSGWSIPEGNYAGQVIDISPAAYIKVQMWSGAPVWDNKAQTIFYLSKNSSFTKR